MLARWKRVTDPPLSNISSGSDHHGREQCESCCLSHLIHCFLEENDGDDTQHQSSLKDDDDNDSFTFQNHVNLSSDHVKDSIKNMLNLSNNNSVLLNHVSKATNNFNSLKPNKSIFLSNIMMFLRELGYNAGVCKTRWESKGGVTAGSYEFIDVIVDDSGDVESPGSCRWLVDVDFRGEFEIVRPTTEYEGVLHVLPGVYVGRMEEMKQIVRLMCEAAKRSLKIRHLHLPPWRTNPYMQLKWFGPYQRTINPISSHSLSPHSLCVKCRAVGFDALARGPYGLKRQ